jgi:signal transduction histidine kinase/CheY-like chemotaxis protein
MNLLKPFFDGSYEPHGYCLLWNPGLIWTHVVSDLFIAAAYFSIPLALVSLIRRRRDLEFSGMFYLFAVFILACGMTHILSVWNLWHGDYGVEAVVKAVTAAASVPTALILWPLIPRALAVPSPSQLQAANADLAAMVAERDSALEQVRAEAAQRLTSQLLTFSRSQRIEARVIDAAALVSGMADLLQHSVGASAELVIAATPGTCPVQTDATQLELAILNLVVNARDAMPAGGRIDIAVDRAADQVAIRVTDRGVGMSRAVAERALEPFFTTKGPGQGTGLGLSMALGVAQAAGGTLTIDSEEGRGTTVSILLPLTGQDAEPVADGADPLTSPPPATPARTILLVDDDDAVRQTIADMLFAAGHEVTAVASGKAALAALADTRFDLLLLDYAMPGLNGAQVAEAALAQRPDQPIVFVSGYSDSAAIDAVLNGRARILSKPVDSRALLEAVAEATA